MSKFSLQSLKALLKIALAAGLIYWMVQRGVLDLEVFHLLTQPIYLLLFLLIILAQLVLATLRWVWLVRSQKIPIPFKYALSLTFVGIFFNFFIPGGVGGDVVKGYYFLKDHPEKKTVAAITILLDRIIGVYGMILIGLGALLLNLDLFDSRPALKSMTAGVLLFFVLMTAFFALSLSRRFRNLASVDQILKVIPGGTFIHNIYEAFHSYRSEIRILIGGLGISLASQFLLVGFIVLAARSMGETAIPLGAYFFAVPLGAVCMAIPVAPAGIGIGQASVFFLFKLFLGYETSVGPNSFTLYQAVTFLWGLVGGVIYLKKNSLKQSRLDTIESAID